MRKEKVCLFWLFLHLLNEHLFTHRVAGVETQW